MVTSVPLRTPKDTQSDYIRDITKLITSDTNKLAIIQASTGFGKTFCNVLSSLTNREFIDGPILYLTRTVQQAEQIIRDFNNEATIRNISISGIQIASRKHSCLIPKIRYETDYNVQLKLCQNARSQKYDKIFNQKELEEFNAKKSKFCIEMVIAENYCYSLEDIKSSVLDNACPYLTAFNYMKKSKIIVGTFNYFFVNNIRRLLELENIGLLIVDEGHNIEDKICELNSITIKHNHFKEIINQIEGLRNQYPKENQNEIIDSKINDVNVIEQNLLTLIDHIIENDKELKQSQEESLILLLHEFCDKFNSINFENIKDTIENIHGFILKHYTDPDDYNLLKLNKAALAIREFMKFIINFIKEHTKHYGVIIQYKSLKKTFSIKIQLLTPVEYFNQYYQYAKKILICSGSINDTVFFAKTIGQLNTNEIRSNYYLNIDFEKNMRLFTITHDEFGHELNTRKKNLDQHPNTLKIYYRSTLINLIKKIKINGGIIIFVSSYAKIDELGFDEKVGIPYGSKNIKIIKEKRTTKVEDDNDNDEKIDDTTLTDFEVFKENVNNNQKTVLIAVFGGKYSEGIDFKDNLVRLIISVGIPFPSIKKPYLKLKKIYLNENIDTDYGTLGDEWYNNKAVINMSQAFGRGWRNEDDWCIGIFIDSKTEFREDLPDWLKNNFLNETSVEQTIQEANVFLKEKNKTMKKKSTSNNKKKVNLSEFINYKK